MSAGRRWCFELKLHRVILYWKARYVKTVNGSQIQFSAHGIKEQGGFITWYVGIAWAHRSKWKYYLVVRRQIQSLGQIVDPFRLWALLKSRGKRGSLVFMEGYSEKWLRKLRWQSTQSRGSLLYCVWFNISFTNDDPSDLLTSPLGGEDRDHHQSWVGY